jgi:hypothetical protein
VEPERREGETVRMRSFYQVNSLYRSTYSINGGDKKKKKKELEANRIIIH